MYTVAYFNWQSSTRYVAFLTFWSANVKGAMVYFDRRGRICMGFCDPIIWWGFFVHHPPLDWLLFCLAQLLSRIFKAVEKQTTHLKALAHSFHKLWPAKNNSVEENIVKRRFTYHNQDFLTFSHVRFLANNRINKYMNKHTWIKRAPCSFPLKLKINCSHF